MAKKYTYSRQLGLERFEAVEFDSFDEARKVVDKAVRDRTLELSNGIDAAKISLKDMRSEKKDSDAPTVTQSQGDTDAPDNE